jgi:hypothetical protein
MQEETTQHDQQSPANLTCRALEWCCRDIRPGLISAADFVSETKGDFSRGRPIREVDHSGREDTETICCYTTDIQWVGGLVSANKRECKLF